MNDAELMTTAPDVPIVEVKEIEDTIWGVWVNGKRIGVVSKEVGGYVAASVSLYSPDFPALNAAVKWLLDQHKGGQS